MAVSPEPNDDPKAEFFRLFRIHWQRPSGRPAAGRDPRSRYWTPKEFMTALQRYGCNRSEDTIENLANKNGKRRPAWPPPDFFEAILQVFFPDLSDTTPEAVKLDWERMRQAYEWGASGGCPGPDRTFRPQATGNGDSTRSSLKQNQGDDWRCDDKWNLNEDLARLHIHGATIDPKTRQVTLVVTADFGETDDAIPASPAENIPRIPITIRLRRAKIRYREPRNLDPVGGSFLGSDIASDGVKYTTVWILSDPGGKGVPLERAVLASAPLCRWHVLSGKKHSVHLELSCGERDIVIDYHGNKSDGIDDREWSIVRTVLRKDLARSGKTSPDDDEKQLLLGSGTLRRLVTK